MGNKKGFTLIELAIVLVIVGLIAGGVLVGTTLMEAARTRRVVQEATQYQQAIATFRNKYRQLPGDMTDLPKFFPNMKVFFVGAPAGMDFRSGNGDGKIWWMAEGPEAWIQLEMAGLLPTTIENTTKGICSFGCRATPGFLIPRSGAYEDAGWTIGLSKSTGNNMFMLGGKRTYLANKPVLKAIQTLSIDTKLDDGKPSTGKMRTRNAFGYDNCVDVLDNHYIVDNEKVLCSFEIGIGS